MSQSISSPQSAPPVVDYNAHPKPSRRGPWLNLRVILFILVIGGVVGYPVYIYMHEAMTGGITKLSNGYTEVNLKTISLFPFDQQVGTINDVPERFRALDGQKVILVGEMWVTDNAGGDLKNFDLVYSIAKCCFSGPAQVQHFVKSTSSKGEPLPFYNGEVRVKGTLKVNVTYDAGKVASVYHVAVDSIEPL